MYALQEAKQSILTELKKVIGKECTISIDELVYPPDTKLGDLSFACFALAKGLKRNPAELASEIAAHLGPKGVVKEIKAVGPYVNFILDDSVFGSEVIHEIQTKEQLYGTHEVGQGKRVMVEYASPNTLKEIHVGHTRNFSIGQSTVQLLTALGYEVVPVVYINDLGAHIATILWGIKNLFGTEPIPKEDPIPFFAKVYVAATTARETDAVAKAAISEVYLDLEQLKGSYLSLWKKTRAQSIRYLKNIFKEFGIEYKAWYFESELIADTKTIIDGLIEKGIVVKSDGAWVVPLEEEKLGVNLLIKTDGTLLYNAKDLALALRKEEDYHPVRSLYVIDVRQSLPMRQLFATLKKMGFTKDLAHLSYEFVTLKEGAMSSRKGNIIRYEQLRDAMLANAKEETQKRHPDWSARKIEQTARGITFAAIRFQMLKQDPDKQIVFGLEEALSTEGFHAPYVLYTVARIESILKKAPKRSNEPLEMKTEHESEHHLIQLLARYPEVVFAAGQQLKPSLVAQYVFDVCQTFSALYASVPILQADDSLKMSRIALITSTKQTIQNGLKLLGIETLKEM